MKHKIITGGFIILNLFIFIFVFSNWNEADITTKWITICTVIGFILMLYINFKSSKL